MKIGRWTIVPSQATRMTLTGAKVATTDRVREAQGGFGRLVVEHEAGVPSREVSKAEVRRLARHCQS